LGLTQRQAQTLFDQSPQWTALFGCCFLRFDQ
jgi:hypothetical protein